ncbi:GntR family transcriptional regulator [Candidatus Woesearchaeota archaeon]|nr:GntR family transcriptional regulator [Candidatus Woesearchaeota archaeon]
MDIYKLKFTVLQLEIFKLFCIKTGQQLSQRQMAGFLNVSPTAVAKSLPLLVKEGILNVTRGQTNVNFVALNTESKKVRAWKQSENINHLHSSGLVEFLEKEFLETTIYLKGSYAIGNDYSGYDLEIVITGSAKYAGKKVDVLQFEKKLERKIIIHHESKESDTSLGIFVGGAL